MWDGARSGTEGAKSFFGADEVWELTEVLFIFSKAYEIARVGDVLAPIIQNASLVFFDYQVDYNITAMIKRTFAQNSSLM
jgi:hypothetical protein